MLVNNQQYRAEIVVFYNKLCVIKCYYNFSDFQKSCFARIFDFRSLLMVLVLLVLFHSETLAYHVVIILQCTRRVNFFWSYIFIYLSSVNFQSHICFYSYFIELSGDVKKNSGPKSKPDQSFSFCHWNFNTIAMHNFLKIQSLLAYSWIIVGLFVFLKRT